MFINRRQWRRREEIFICTIDIHCGWLILVACTRRRADLVERRRGRGKWQGGSDEYRGTGDDHRTDRAGCRSQDDESVARGAVQPGEEQRTRKRADGGAVMLTLVRIGYYGNGRLYVYQLANGNFFSIWGGY